MGNIEAVVEEVHMSDYQQDDGRYVGRQVSAIRRRRGWSQQVLADRVGVSRGAIAKYENGERPVDSRETLYALAQALCVRVGDLTGHEQDRLDPSAAGFHKSVPDIETALWTAGNTTPATSPRSLPELAELAKQATRLRLACDFSALGPLLPPLLTDCYRHTRDATGTDLDTAWDVFATVANNVYESLKARGYLSLAWTAAQEVERAAQNVGGTAGFALAVYARSQILLARPGSLKAALDGAVSTAGGIGSDARTLGEVETLGMLHLQASLVTAALGGDPGLHLDEASECAVRLGEASRTTSMLRNPSFGPENVILWRMAAAMEQREPGEVLKLAPTLNPDAIPHRGRRAQYFVEVGRAYALQRDYRKSLSALLRAEHTAPQHVRSMNIVRELVGHMMRSARRDLTTGDLGRLATRVGAIPV